MTLAGNIFFGIITVLMVIAVVLQFFIVGELDESCPDSNLTTAPTIAGLTLAVSFVTNGLWLFAKKKGLTLVRRTSLLAWVVLVLSGIAAAGATLGQIQLYDTVCPAMESETDFNTAQYISIVLLIISVAAPHYRKKEATVALASQESLVGQPITLDRPSGANLLVKPLVFV